MEVPEKQLTKRIKFQTIFLCKSFSNKYWTLIFLVHFLIRSTFRTVSFLLIGNFGYGKSHFHGICNIFDVDIFFALYLHHFCVICGILELEVTRLSPNFLIVQNLYFPSSVPDLGTRIVQGTC